MSSSSGGEVRGGAGEEAGGERRQGNPDTVTEPEEWVNLCGTDVTIFDATGEVVHVFQALSSVPRARVDDVEKDVACVAVRSQFLPRRVDIVPVITFDMPPRVRMYEEAHGKRVIVEAPVAASMTAEQMARFRAVYTPCLFPDLEWGAVYDCYGRKCKGTRGLVQMWPLKKRRSERRAIAVTVLVAVALFVAMAHRRR